MNTIFGKIIEGELPADVVYEDDEVLAFRDVNPAPCTSSYPEAEGNPDAERRSAEDQALLGHMMLTAAKLAKQEGIDERGYRLIMN